MTGPGMRPGGREGTRGRPCCPPAQSREGGGPADGDRPGARRRGGDHRDARRRRAAPPSGDPASRGAGGGAAGGRRPGRAGPHARDAIRTTLYQLALGGSRVAHRRSRGPGCPDRVPGAGAPGRGARSPPRGAVRLRGRVSTRGAGPRLASPIGADHHGVRGAAQPLPVLGGHLAPGARLHAVRPSDHLRSTMNILISNDDGILARGLAVLGEVCASLGQVTVVAPDREQSVTSHSLTLHRPVRATRRPDGAFQVDGTPTDCVLLAIGMLMPEKPDFVISGINHGQNMGEDVFYSGTVAAAMEGLVAGIPSIAVSYAGSDVDMLETHRDGLRALLQRIVAVRDFPAETLLNINLPAIPGDQVKGVKVTHLGSRVFSEEIALMKDPWGKEIYWIGGGRITWTGDADSDFRATSDGYISGTPLHMDMTNYGLIEVVRRWLAGD